MLSKRLRLLSVVKGSDELTPLRSVDFQFRLAKNAQHFKRIRNGVRRIKRESELAASVSLAITRGTIGMWGSEVCVLR